MQKFDEYITESMVDIPRSNLDPTVFLFHDDGGQPFLNPTIKKQIQMGIEEISSIVPIKKFYIVGSILTKYYSQNSDIDVSVEVFKEDVDDLAQGKLLLLLKNLNGKLATGTTHPINFYILLDEPDDDRYDAIYDVMSEKWIKEPVNLAVNIAEYVQNFQKVVSKIDITIAQLRRDIVDYEELTNFTADDIADLKKMLNQKLLEITEKIETLVDIRHAIIDKKKKVFKKPLTPEEIQQYKTKNVLPEVIVDKMLQRYYYWDFIKKLEKILDDKELIDDKDIEKIQKINQQACLKSFESYIQTDKNILTERIRPVKLSKIDWKSPKGRSHLYNVYRSMKRKSLHQVPNIHQHALTASNIGSAKKIVDVAKNAPSGIWRLTPSQVKWIAVKYHFIPPDPLKNIKHLGNTGIMVWRKGKNAYYLVKQPSMFGR